MAALFCPGPLLNGTHASLSSLNPDYDVAIGSFSYLFNAQDSPPPIKTGLYMGAYMNMKSPFFTFFFNAKNLYSTYEAGIALNRIDVEDFYAISFPLTLDLSYRIPIFRRFAVFPFFGTGLDLLNMRYDREDHLSLYYFFDTGLELKYEVWKDTYIKIKATYGIIFVESARSGYVHFIKLRFPLPFIP